MAYHDEKGVEFKESYTLGANGKEGVHSRFFALNQALGSVRLRCMACIRLVVISYLTSSHDRRPLYFLPLYIPASHRRLLTFPST